MTHLNEKQQEAARFLNGIAAVIAVPGSGKTHTMTSRIGMLIKNHEINPESILGLTFTRNAAQAMKEKLVPVLDHLASRVTLSTIHSFCHHLLRNEGRSFEILSGKEQMKFIKKIMQDLKLKSFPTGIVIREISLAKSNLISIEEFRSLYDGDETMQGIADVFECYQAEKKKRLLLDFDDLLVETCKLLQENEEIRERYRQTFRHVMIDEFQDTNPAQMEILKLLIGHGNGSFWICGDDFQAIYAFTGASVGNILNFKTLFPEAEQYILNVNYRSTPQILSACQNLIRHNVRKIEKTMKAQKADGDRVVILEAANEDDEALSLVGEIKDLVENRGYTYKDIAVLYRANFQSMRIEEVFCQHKIPFHIENGVRFYDRFEVKILLDYLRLIASPKSDEGDDALRSIINIPNRYIGRKFVSELEEFSTQRRLHLYEGLQKMPVEVPYLKKNVRAFTSLLDPLIKEVEEMEPSELIHLLRDSLDYDRFITEDEVPGPDESKIANIDQLQIVAGRYKGIQSLLNYTDSFQDAKSQDSEGVSLMTIHKSKGLEFPVVFVIGLVDGSLPNRNGDIEEERRICFVALSRAMKQLYLTYSQTCQGKTIKKSPFLDEILGVKN